MKISIIGGGGLVGSMTAYALQCGGVVSHICLIDANKEMALGQATDLLHGASLAADQRISAGDMSDVGSSNVVVITAGLRRKPDESRLDLINRNVDLFLGLLDQVKAAGLKDNAYLVVVSNPVDVLTYLAVQRSGLPWQRVIGLGTQLDTARFRSYLARRLQVPPTQVQALILGEHGDSMVPIWSSATVAGLPLEQWPGFSPVIQKEVFEETKTAGAQLIKLKGGSGFGVGLSIREVVHALALDSRRVLPVSTLQMGLYGLRDVCLSIPTVIGCGGVRQQIELPLTQKERLALVQSARVLRETISQVEQRIGKGKAGSAAPAPVPGPVTTNGRAIPRSAWQASEVRRPQRSALASGAC
jgi:L-lactate dehydrogenase